MTSLMTRVAVATFRRGRGRSGRAGRSRCGRRAGGSRAGRCSRPPARRPFAWRPESAHARAVRMAIEPPPGNCDPARDDERAVAAARRTQHDRELPGEVLACSARHTQRQSLTRVCGRVAARARAAIAEALDSVVVDVGNVERSLAVQCEVGGMAERAVAGPGPAERLQIATARSEPLDRRQRSIGDPDRAVACDRNTLRAPGTGQDRCRARPKLPRKRPSAP